MKLAVQENLVPGKNYSEKLINIEKYGFQGVEVWGRDLPEKLEEIKSALSVVKVEFSTVCTGYGGDLLGPDRKSRETAVLGLEEKLKLCADLGGIGVITVPTFREPKILDLYPLYPNVLEIEKKILVEECRIIGEYAEDLGVYVLLEPLNRYETHFINKLQQAVEICKMSRMENIRIMADLFHMNIEESDMPQSLMEARDYIFHVHLADSNRVLPSYGHTDFESCLGTLRKNRYKHFMAIECKAPENPEEEFPKCVNYLKKFI